MLIRALCDYYDVLAANGDVNEKGFSKVLLQYAITLSPDGRITGINDIRRERQVTDKKGKVKTEYDSVTASFPFREKSTSIKAYNIDHRPKYIFGMTYDPASDTLSVTDKVANDKFKEKNLEFIEGMDDPMVNAFRNFLENFVPEDETENPIIKKFGKEMAKNPSVCFSLDGFGGKYLHECRCIIEKARSEAAEEKPSEDERTCAISGKKGKIARTHADVKGILGQKAGTFVCVKGSAGESYGKTQAYTSNISEESMSKYTEAFNYLTSHVDPNTQKFTNKAYIDSMTVIFFAADKKSDEEDALLRFFTCDDKVDAAALAPQLKSLMEHISKGDAVDINRIVTDSSADYYVAGFVPNSSRVCMKFCYRDTFGNILENVIRHQRDIAMRKSGKPVTIWQITNELIRPTGKGAKDNNETVPAPLSAALMNSIFKGDRYPDSLYYTVLNRIKTDNDTKDNNLIKLNSVRAGLIKAYLNRNFKEDFTMGLDENRKDTAYLCGRLFNILEFIQRKAQGKDINTTIKDSYFSTACSTPAIVFPQILMLAQNHLKKIGGDEAYKLHKRIGLIINDIDNFPTTLSATEQGRFFIGYYHQDNWYLKNSTDTDKNE